MGLPYPCGEGQDGDEDRLGRRRRTPPGQEEELFISEEGPKSKGRSGKKVSPRSSHPRAGSEGMEGVSKGAAAVVTGGGGANIETVQAGGKG